MKNLVDNPKILKTCENHAITKCCEVASGLSLNISAITPKLDKSIITKGSIHQYRTNLLEQLRYFCSQYISFGPRGNIPSNQSSNQHFSLLVGVFISQVLEYIINIIISEISVFSLKHDETKILNNQLTYIITSNTLLIKIADLSRFFDRNDYEEELKSSISVNSGNNAISNVYTLRSTGKHNSIKFFG
jgi:short-subunit dehydrogenase involved in D-alanine esterification of teichoic acids